MSSQEAINTERVDEKASLLSNENAIVDIKGINVYRNGLITTYIYLNFLQERIPPSNLLTNLPMPL